MLDTTVSDTDPYLLAVLQRHINELLDQITTRDQLVERVRYSIACTIGTDNCTAREISQRLCISQRTMNRTLRCFGTSFRAMKAAVMEEIAKAALAESSTSITAIALQLGYSEVAAFNHAFKKKTGLSPSAYRTLSAHP
ncbi:MAG: helix-turn-helix domain-containing protein [Candidatus Thiodiazotropha sp. (ex. Lucinoma kazani)]